MERRMVPGKLGKWNDLEFHCRTLSSSPRGNNARCITSKWYEFARSLCVMSPFFFSSSFHCCSFSLQFSFFFPASFNFWDYINLLIVIITITASVTMILNCIKYVNVGERVKITRTRLFILFRCMRILQIT